MWGMAGKRGNAAVAAFFLLLSGFAAGAAAQPMKEDRACDRQFMDAVESKGWLEAQRESAQNQNLIYKPDSVLEYSCFQQFMEAIAVKGSPRFSESKAFGGYPQGISNISTDVALQQVVGLSLIGYLKGTFPHTYRGGRLESSTAPASTRKAGEYLCDAMSYVWQKTKCTSFGEKSKLTDPDIEDESDIDGFYEFTRYARLDPRKLPEQFASCEAAKENIRLTMRSAYNLMQAQQGGAGGGGASSDSENLFVLPEENPNNDQSYKDDPLVSHLQFILPDSGCGTNGSPAGGPIPTGVTVTRNDKDGGQTTYDEKICTNPGCSYNGQSCVRQ